MLAERESFVIRLLAILALTCGGIALATAKDLVDPFPDTPENRALFESSLQAYEEIDREHSHFATVNGIRMHYLEWGDERGIPLIWSHGYSSSAFEMVQVGQKLAEAGYHVLAITYRGHGQTQVTDYNFSLADIADDIAALMDQKGYACAVIGGLSLGGGVTTTFYENYPARTMAVVLEDGGADGIQVRTERGFEKMKRYFSPPPEDPFAHRYPDRFLMFRDIVKVYLPNWDGEPIPAEAMPIFQSWIRQGEDRLWGFHIDEARLFGEGPAMIDPGRSHDLPLLHQSWRRVNPLITYRNLAVPMLIIDPTGDDDGPNGSFSPDFERLRSLHSALIEHVEYPGTNHAAHPRRPEWFLRDMKELLERVRASGSDACLGRK